MSLNLLGNLRPEERGEPITANTLSALKDQMERRRERFFL
jgi:hypothetical protein